ncbi:MAG: tetratricopeptide (TPR) repeat protein, partial [Paraglaciecola sp.]
MNGKHSGQYMALVKPKRQTSIGLPSSVLRARTMLFTLILMVYSLVASATQDEKDQTTQSATSNHSGGFWYAKGEYNQAIASFEKTLVSDIKNFGEAHPDVATTRSNLGLAWKAKGQYDKAIAYYELALASGVNNVGEAHPDVATMRSNLGLVWHAKGQYDTAIHYYELALASNLLTFDQDHPSVATI